MTEAVGALAVDGEARPWRRAALWLVVLAPFFFLSYGFANWVTAQRDQVGAIVFGWERGIPFLPWTIVPYWSIDALYGLSLLLCRSRDQLDTHARRLITAQIVAVACFLAFPLRFVWPKPWADGIAGWMFDALAGFDLPFNQAPSLHIALLVILWPLYVRHAPRALAWPLHAWFALIGISVLTTWQHHFVDLPTGALLGFLCLWLWPEGASHAVAGARMARDPRRVRLALIYACGALGFAVLAVAMGGLALWLLWPAVSLALVALAYGALGPVAFQKSRDGRMSLAARVLFAPYRFAAWLNSRAWTMQRPDDSPIAEDVSLGRFPTATDLDEGGYAAVVDLTAEFPAAAAKRHWTALPLLDRATPEPAILAEAARAIEAGRRRGAVLVCCALGYARSAAAVATWLAANGRAADVASAIAVVRQARPGVALGPSDTPAIAAAAAMARQGRDA